MSKKFFIYSVVLKSLIIGFLISGFTVILVNGIVNMDFSTFTYFTIISNIFTFITTIFFLICTIKRYKGFYLRPNKVFFLFRFFSLIAITITGFIFDFLIVPIGGIEYLMSYQSVCFHVIKSNL